MNELIDKYIPLTKGQSRKRLLFITASSGGGHIGLLKGILEELSAKSNLEIDVIDLYEIRFIRPLRWLSRIREYSDKVWGYLLGKSDNPTTVRTLFSLYQRPLQSALSRLAHEKFPDGVDGIIALHHISAQCLDSLAKTFSTSPTTIVYISDYEPHWFWIAKADHYVVASDNAQQRLERFGATRSQITKRDYLHCQTPLRPITKVAGCDQQFRVLISSGAQGARFDRISPILNALDRQASDYQGGEIIVEVVCGKNTRLKKKLLAQQTANITLEVSGFVDDLPARLNRSDIAVLRAGPQTLTEAAFTKTPVIVFSWHSHELANCELFEKRNHAIRVTCPEDIAKSIIQTANKQKPLVVNNTPVVTNVACSGRHSVAASVVRSSA